MKDRHVTDTEGRVWSRYAIPDGVTLANGLSKEKIQKEIREEIRKKRARAKEQERKEYTPEPTLLCFKFFEE